MQMLYQTRANSNISDKLCSSSMLSWDATIMATICHNAY